ncbi:MAG: acyloxyacyl hydrolase [Paludibacter sp.]
MIKALVIYIPFLFANILLAQTNDQYSIKIQGIYGNILNHDPVHVGPLIQDAVRGAEISVEFQTMGEKPWQQYQNFPIIGVGAVWLNLGNPEKLGDAFALYPYISLPLWRNKYFHLNMKGGMGASYLTKTYYNTNKDSYGNTLPSLTGTNAAIGSNLNIYFSGGGSLEIPIAKGFSATAEYTWNHMSNGSAVAPNTGLNLLNGFVGLKYYPKYKVNFIPQKQNITDIKKTFSVEMIAAGGFRQLYYQDQKTYPTASFVLGVYRPITNYFRMGLGMDVFYDGVYNGNTGFKRTYLAVDEFKNKLRVGLSWQNELMFGRMTAGFHFGLYLYNPLKNLEPYTDAQNGELNKSIIYPYNIDKEDGWLYTRAALKYAVSEHYFISLGLKTHLQKAEFIEWGLGYKF